MLLGEEKTYQAFYELVSGAEASEREWADTEKGK